MDLPRPEVTVTDPRQPGHLVAVAEPDPPRLGRRGAALLAAATLLGASALFAADVARDRRDAAEQQRLDRVVDVAIGKSSTVWSSSHDPPSGTGTVRGLVRLVNHGGSDVRVVGAQLGGLRSAGSSTTLDAHGGEAVLQLQRTVRCPADGGPPQSEPVPTELVLRLETPSGLRSLSLDGDGLPLASLDDGVQRACAFPPLGDRVRLSSTVVRIEDRTAVLQVELLNGGRRPVRLLSLVPSRGLVVLSVDGDAAGLPVVLPARTRRSADVRTFEVRLGLVCGALIGTDVMRPFEELSAIVEEEDSSQITSVGALTRDPDRGLRQLAERTCSSG